MVLPGFQDAHCHPISSGLDMVRCNLNDETTAEGYLSVVAAYAAANPGYYRIAIGSFNYADESASATVLAGVRTEYYPEPQSSRTDLLAGMNVNGFEFNQFFPWQMNEDGTEEETINHVGRHDLQGGFNRSFTNDPNLVKIAALLLFGDETAQHLHTHRVEAAERLVRKKEAAVEVDPIGERRDRGRTGEELRH